MADGAGQLCSSTLSLRFGQIAGAHSQPPPQKNGVLRNDVEPFFNYSLTSLVSAGSAGGR